MARFKDIPVTRKLMAITMIASTAALLLASAGFVGYEVLNFRQGITRDLSTLAEIIGNQSTAALTYGDKNTAHEILAALRAKKHVTAAALYDKDGRLLASYSGGGATDTQFPARPAMETQRFEKSTLVLFHEVRLDGDFAGTVYLKSDLQELNERMVRYAGIILLIMGVSLSLTLFLSSRLQRVISRPVSQLAEAARLVSVMKDYSIRALKYGDDELGRLTIGFNEMLDQIQRRDTDLRRAHDELEARVQERTEDLRGEIAEHKRTELALKQQFVRLSLLNQISRAISDRQDTESILQVVLRQLEDHLALDLGVVMFYDEKGEAFNVAAMLVKSALLAGKLGLRVGSVLTMAETGLKACEQGRIVSFADTIKEPAAFAEKLAVTGWRSALAVPLMVEDKLFGVLVSARLKPDSFGSGDCEFLRMLSDHVALAAHQARLHQELEQAYNDLRQTQAAVLQQERLRALGQMASGIAHDVNNALSPVVGFTELLIKTEPALSANGKKYLKYIRTAGEDIAHIVARLREFYRVRDEKEELQELDLNSLVTQVVDMTRPRWRDIPQSKGITIEVRADLGPEVPRLAGIESEIREAFTNLVLNAVDAMPRGGEVVMRTRTLAPENGRAGESRVAVEVIDSGVGMDEETRKRCLEPFFSTKGKRGTGLGLAMVYGVMERHHGKIEIYSDPGKGTTFRLMFPVRTAEAAAHEDESGTTAGEPLQILCIDDEPLLRELIKEMLERDGHSVEVSDTGQSGLDEFRIAKERGRPFDVVITDLGMPYFDGRQVARALKQESPATPVIMLTGWGAFMKEDGDTPVNVDGIVSKPPRSKELRAALSKYQKTA